MSAIVHVKVSELVKRLKAQRAAFEKDAQARLATIDKARAKVTAPGWAKDKLASWAAEIGAALASGDYSLSEYGELVQVNREAKTISKRPPTANLDSAIAELNEDERRITDARDRAIAAFTERIDAYELTEENGNGGTVEVTLGTNPLEEFASVSVPALHYAERYTV